MSRMCRLFRYDPPYPKGVFIMPDDTFAPALECVQAWAVDRALAHGFDRKGFWVICITPSQKLEWSARIPVPPSSYYDPMT